MSKPVFENVFTLSGRRNRRSYFLYLLAVLAAGGLLGIMLFASTGPAGEPAGWMVALLVAFLIPIIVSGWTVGAQRCRDFGWTGWAILISAVPVVGWIFSCVMLFMPGTVGSNRYGPDPLADA